jgi:CheY-like chemotaxis protein
MEAVLGELKALRAGQERILHLLERADGASAGGGMSLGMALEDEAPAKKPEVRARRRKSVLLIDDDEGTRQAAVAALEHAEVPVRTASDGNAALAAIAEDKPDVIVMELGLEGPMPGKDVVNMIKATMEWVDLPIILYTRLPIESQKEARTIHGADEFVLKQAGPDALVARVITVFRKS